MIEPKIDNKKPWQSWDIVVLILVIACVGGLLYAMILVSQITPPIVWKQLGLIGGAFVSAIIGTNIKNWIAGAISLAISGALMFIFFSIGDTTGGFSPIITLRGISP